MTPMALPEDAAARAGLVRRLRDTGLLTPDRSLSFRELAVLVLAATGPERLRTVKDMAEAMRVNKPSITRATDRLAALGLVQRRTSRSDLRQVTISATPGGEQRLAEICAALAPQPPAAPTGGAA
ncbi:MarR family transcriptional regulator [Falsiroseomonas selenitidurans]|uniref:MarR family transcriptional regulator n=1 Tax=Falsiroseomonas selenitidurans TaxID=2716335 RepID=A0ABX1DZ96_9PROT|nr:MarR family transcriptional regulator [Falsiroseomonas selenitidurans]NKC30171.1 MarR family transcriptional regulator [Falsiroseomonas selenitidurans]